MLTTPALSQAPKVHKKTGIKIDTGHQTDQDKGKPVDLEKDAKLEAALQSIPTTQTNPQTGEVKKVSKETKKAHLQAALGTSAEQEVPTPNKPVVTITSGPFAGQKILYESPRQSKWHEFFWAITLCVASVPLIFFGHTWWIALKIPTAVIIGYQVVKFVEYPTMKLFEFEGNEWINWIWFGVELFVCISFTLFYIYFERFSWLWTGLWVSAILGKRFYFLTVWTFGLEQEMQYQPIYTTVLVISALLGTWIGRFMGEKFLILGTPILGANILSQGIGELTAKWPTDGKEYRLAAFHTARYFHLFLFIMQFSISIIGIIVQKIADNKKMAATPDMFLKIDMNQTGVADDISEVRKGWFDKLKDTVKNGVRKIAGKATIEEEEGQKAYEKKLEFKAEVAI